jgi:carboxyl-terminal processing protease
VRRVAVSILCAPRQAGYDGSVRAVHHRNHYLLAAAAAGALAGAPACSSGNGGSSNPAAPSAWVAGTFQPASTFAAQCASPRSGTDPATGKAYPDKPGSTLAENNWLRSWTHDLYLWYREVPDQNPASYTTTADYFNVLKTTATTPSGNPKDKFHFTYATTQWEALSQSGVEAGYGAQWVIIASRPPRQVVVAYTEPNSPATDPSVNLARGAQVLTVDGVDLVTANDSASIDKLNAGLFPSSPGGSHTFSILDLGAASPRTVTMVAANVTETPVQNVGTIGTHSGPVGYMLFNDHIATAEAQLVTAFTQLQGAGVSDLVLDIRYNGGGYLDIASEVAYMIAGPGPTTGQGFEKTVFNDKYTTTDPVTGERLAPVPFHSTSQGFSGPQGQPLPTLNLPRVFVLSSPNTCSASEAIMNGLRGVNVQVIQIGTTTCGKPYGFYPQDNCGTTYFSIEFQGVNAQGFGDYPDGFSPVNTTSSPGVALPGCSVGDDFSHALGDPAEGRLSAALAYRADQSCPSPAAASTNPDLVKGASASDGLAHKSPWRENRIYRR